MADTVWDRIERARARHDVLQHPFYARWSAGELSAAELARYSGQYRHAVTAIADLSDAAAAALPERPELAEHAAEERDHIALWDGFVGAVGGDGDTAPTGETADCVEVWTERDGALAALARLYAIESGQPQISETKLEGLAEHYGVDSAEGTRYFTVHRGRDVEHAAEGRELLEELIATPADEDAVVAAAERAFAANWRLLDGV
ncbi:MAG TPA: iron-containing redox enzyme family protein [Solirubrobacterales bacterium]|nr:iron-containing redox enzyme family protein [Solirubrobacterales bacterium]